MEGFAFIQWLLQPVDPARAHEISTLVSWHGRLMVLSWAVLLPLGVIIARFFKVTRSQDWPRQLDNKFWWHGHLSLQYGGGVIMLAGVVLIWLSGSGDPQAVLHRWLGYVVLGLGLVQFLAGWFRGSKGGPSDAQLRGDHYDMTLRRRVFEHAHKGFGYGALLLGVATILTGLWMANAPRWMWLSLGLWWFMLLVVFAMLQKRGPPIGSYQAIWGPDKAHPGNNRTPKPALGETMSSGGSTS
jgi:hypothetical protein